MSDDQTTSNDMIISRETEGGKILVGDSPDDPGVYAAWDSSGARGAPDVGTDPAAALKRSP